jgi:hypothetical protein
MTASLSTPQPDGIPHQPNARRGRVFGRPLHRFLGPVRVDQYFVWTPELAVRTRASDEAYLAEATDFEDLNRRLHTLERQHETALRWLRSMY